MPAYYAEKTLEATYRNLPQAYDEVILCDDGSQDNTSVVSKKLGITTIRHNKNIGYGGNQKTLYAAALAKNPDIIVMVHPDNQYDTTSVPAMVNLITSGSADLVLGTRMENALANHMPLWKYAGNRFLTTLQNITFRTRLSEFHSGLRAYNATLLKKVPFEKFSNDFVFDSQMIAWHIAHGYKLGEVPTNCYYNDLSSSISFRRSVRYGLATTKVLADYALGHYHSMTPKDNRVDHGSVRTA